MIYKDTYNFISSSKLESNHISKGRCQLRNNPKVRASISGICHIEYCQALRILAVGRSVRTMHSDNRAKYSWLWQRW